jgi:hypothetical protein
MQRGDLARLLQFLGADSGAVNGQQLLNPQWLAAALQQDPADPGLPAPQAPFAYAKPLLLEQVAYDFPALKIIIAHIGFPWTVDAITLMRKHQNVFADISALCYRPWQLYSALLTALEATVTERLFFGTDWPFTTLEQTLKALEQLPDIGKNCHLPTVPKALLDELIHKDSLAQLGIA